MYIVILILIIGSQTTWIEYTPFGVNPNTKFV